MKIDGSPRIPSATSRVDRRKASSAAAFAEHLPSDGSETPRSSAAGGIAAANPLLALQEVDPDDWQAGRTAAYARDLLDDLDELKLALLDGRNGAATLDAIRGRLAARVGSTDDARLKAIVDEIEVRAAVELAKRGMAP